MNIRILIASILVLVSLIIHVYPGNNKTSFLGRCTWRCLSIDLVINVVGLWAMIALGDFEHKAMYLQYWSIYNLAYIICFFTKAIKTEKITERYLLATQCAIYFGISGFLCV